MSMKIILTALGTIALVGTASTAVPVDVTYNLTAGGLLNTTNLMGGLVPQGGTATVRWPVVGGLFTLGPAQILTLKFTHSAYGTLGLTGVTGAADPTQTGTAGNAIFSKASVSGPPTLLALLSTVLSNFADTLVVRHKLGVGGMASFTLFRNGITGYTVPTGPGGTIPMPIFAFKKISVTGLEIARTPEPATAPLAGLGLLVLSGYAARRRSRRRTRRT